MDSVHRSFRLRLTAMQQAARCIGLACVAGYLSAQSLAPLGAPVLNASGQNAPFTGVASVRFGPTCTGVFITPSAAAGAPAYLLSNGHCVNLLGTNEIVLDRAGQGEGVFFAFADIPAGQRLRVPIRRVAYATQKGIDLSILELDASAADLIAHGVHPSRIAPAPPYAGDPIEVAGIPVTGVPEADRVIRLSRCAAGPSVRLLEGRWHTYDAARNSCLGIRGGSSGSPVFNRDGEVAGLIFTTTWGESPLAACATNRPCEVTSNGTVSPDETSYSVPVAGLTACFNAPGRFDVTLPGCPLDPGRQLTLSGFPLSPVNPNRPGGISSRPPPVSWNTRPQGPLGYYSYKVGPVQSTDCRLAEGYSAPRAVQPDALIDDAFPVTDSREQLCVIAGNNPSIGPSWQAYRFATEARVAIDTTPPTAKPSAMVTPGDTYIVLFEYLASEIAFYDYKVGAPGSIDCTDPAGYRPFVQRLFLDRSRGPYQICAVPLDGAENRGKPWSFILSNIGFLNAASRTDTGERLLPSAITAVTGDFAALPTATLSTEVGITPVFTARRDRGEIWVSLPDSPSTNLALLRLADENGAIDFPVQVARGAPAIFTLDGSGTGAPAGFLTLPDGSRQFLSVPVRLDPARETVLDLYANSILDSLLAATLGGRAVEVAVAAPDRLRLRIPAGFPLRGSLDLVLRAGALISNTARIAIQ